MKYSEFYRLIEQHGWTIKGGKGHYKYVHPGGFNEQIEKSV
jgi:predicted RNA binding protein YcfA (HicA-like mRNA interferase family)